MWAELEAAELSAPVATALVATASVATATIAEVVGSERIDSGLELSLKTKVVRNLEQLVIKRDIISKTLSTYGHRIHTGHVQ